MNIVREEQFSAMGRGGRDNRCGRSRRSVGGLQFDRHHLAHHDDHDDHHHDRADDDQPSRPFVGGRWRSRRDGRAGHCHRDRNADS
jgi:hypothetical protein